MQRIVWTYGLISGAVLGVLFAIHLYLHMNGVTAFEDGMLIGYSAMILAFLLVFFGIRKYRETVGGGTITFGRAFKVGILIALITCAVYVITWEIVYFNFLPDFADKYAAMMVDNMRQEGKSAAEIAKAQRDMAEFKELYKNPLFNVGMTFMEVFPPGLIMTLISAAILRRRSPAEPAMAV